MYSSYTLIYITLVFKITANCAQQSKKIRRNLTVKCVSLIQYYFCIFTLTYQSDQFNILTLLSS